MKAFVTGGTGFIGQRVVRKLLERGYQVAALARSDAAINALRAAGVEPVRGDITDVESLRAGITGADVVFHIAAWYKIGDRDWHKAEEINVTGTRNVLTLANELGVSRIIYVSTVGVFGDTRGELVDEEYVGPAGPFLTEYDRTKWMAHYRVAKPLIEKGAPIIIVQPGGVYGPGDPSQINEFNQLFLKGMMPVIAAPEFTITYAHVEDVAEGILLAAEKGKIGESYILAGPALSMREYTHTLASVAGRPVPRQEIPGRYLKPFTALVGALGSVLPLPAVINRDTLAMAEATYIARSDKARLQLGWQVRPLEEGLRQTLDEMPPVEPGLPEERRRQLAGAALVAAALGLSFWLYRRMRN